MQRNNSFIDILKVITLLLVVIGHNKYLLPENGNTIADYIFTSINPIIYSFHMPLFFMISGAVYKICINNGKYYSFKNLIVNKYNRLIIPFIMVALFLAFPINYLTDVNNKSMIDIFLQTVSVQNGQHIWFILDLFLIFVILYHPIKHVPWYILLPILFVANLCSKFTDIIALQRLLIYAIWFYIGFISFEKLTSKNYRLVEVILYFSIFFLMYFMFNKVRFDNDNIKNSYFFILSFSGCISMISFSNFFVYFIGDKILSLKTYNILKKYSFDIYLYSVPFQTIFIFLFKDKILPPPINFIYSLFWYFLELILAIILSIGFVKLLKFINLKK